MTFLLRSLLVRIWAHISKADVCGFNLFQVHVKRNVRTHYLLLLHLLLGFVSHYCCSFGSSANNIVIVLKLLYIPGKPSAHCFGHFPKCPKFWSLESVPFQEQDFYGVLYGYLGHFDGHFGSRRFCFFFVWSENCKVPQEWITRPKWPETPGNYGFPGSCTRYFPSQLESHEPETTPGSNFFEKQMEASWLS